MPYLKLSTNVPVGDEQASLLMNHLSQAVVEATGKPERFVMIDLNKNSAMLFAGTPDPLAFLECKSIGLSGKQTSSLAASLPHILESRLGISPDRVYIEFSDCRPDFWGWNGSTFG